MVDLKFEISQSADSLGFVFSSTYTHIDQVCEHITQYLKTRLKNISSHLFSVNLVVREGLTNAVRHGNSGDPEKVVKCQMIIENQKTIRLVIEDEGSGFDWRKQARTSAGDEADHGRGGMIMQAYFDRCSYNEKGNILYLEKDISNC